MQNLRLPNNKGQVALVLIFVAAIGLILYAMAMNVTKLSSSKLMVTIAGNTAAAGLASQMASYGENVMQTQLGGRRQKCDYTSILTAIISFIIIIIIIIVMVVAHQWELLGTFGQVALIVAAILAAASVVIQAVYIQPMITRMWNKMQAQISTTEDMFLESSLSGALQKVVSDQVKIRDFYDYDMNGNIAKRWGPYDTSDYRTWPTVPRFVYYYTERLKTYRNVALMASGVFINALNNLVQNIGIDTRRSCCSTMTVNQEFCDDCCVVKDIRKKSCHPSISDAADFPDIPPQCQSGPMPGYPLSYDRFFCNRQSETTLPGLLGQDDGNTHLRKVSILSPASEQVSDDDATGINIFRGEDSEGRLFPLLWLMRDGAINIYNIAGVTTASRNCHWCAVGTGWNVPCDPATAKNTYRFWYYPTTKMQYTQLVLPNPCNGQGCCTNYFNTDPYFNLANLDTRQIDRVGAFPNTILGVNYGNGMFDIAPPPAQCPGNPAASAQAGYWRAGSDDFCSTTAPYYMGGPPTSWCTKWTGMATCLDSNTIGGAASCDCPASARPDVWFNDRIDETILWFKSVAGDIEGLLFPNGVPANPRTISDSLSTWKDNAMATLNALDGCSGCTCDGNSRCINNNDGTCGNGIYGLLDGWRQLFNTWLTADYRELAGSPLWCLPSNSATLSADEYNYVVNGGFAYGSIRSVLNCLEYNANVLPRMQACKDYCDANPAGTSAAQCQNLPRSLLGVNLNAIYAANGCGGPRTSVTINGTPTPLTFREIITLNLRLAENQAVKMRKRHEYLYNVYDYMRAMSEGLAQILSGMTPMALMPGGGVPDRGPIQRVKDAICLIEASKDTGRIESMVYYGWCTGWAAGDERCTHSGRWHLTRAEAWLPKRCEGYGGCCTDTFPWVKTEKRGCCKRCYFMQAHSGRVKARILLYEAPTGSSGRMLNFAAGMPLWQFRESNPFTALTVDNNLYECQSDLTLYKAIAPGAFIINGTAHLSQQNAKCQTAIRNALTQAVGNETCAYYYLQGSQYRIRFGRCDDACAYDPNSN